MTDDTANDDLMLLINFEIDFMMLRVVDDVIVPSKIQMKSDIILADEIEDDGFEEAMTKVRFWIDNIVSRSIAFSRTNPVAMKMLIDQEGRNICANLLMLTPDEPTDEHLAALFQSKMTALSAGALTFGSIEFHSSDMAGISFKFIGETDDLLPSMKDWIGERSYFEKPWWHRDDGSMLDVIPPEDADLTVKPEWAYSLDFLSQVSKPQKDVIVHADFRPQVIDGGKKDE